MSVKNKVLKALSIVTSTVMFATTFASFSPNHIAEVEAKDVQGDFATTLATAHDVFVYTHPYGNIPPASGDSPGYIEIVVQDLIGANAGQFIEIKKIEEHFHITPTVDPSAINNVSEYDFSSATTVREIDPSQASLVTTNGQVKVILTPQRSQDNGCTPDATGGCKWDLNDLESWDADTGLCSGATCSGLTGDISPSSTDYALVPWSSDPMGTLGVQNKMGGYKIYFGVNFASAPESPNFAMIQSDPGKANLRMPAGYDGSEWPLRFRVNWQKTDDALDTTVAPTTAVYSDAAGTTDPVQGQPYYVVVDGLTALTGNPLAAPAGTCTTEVGGVTYSSADNVVAPTGINAGKCIIEVPVVGGVNDVDIPDGLIDISDGGSPMPITMDDVPYTGVDFMESGDISGISNLDCGTPAPNSTTTCNFDLPTGKNLPPDFILGIGDSTPAGSCTDNGDGTATCTSVPTGSQTGMQDAFGKIGADPKEDTGEDVNVVAVPLNPGEVDDGFITNMDCGSPEVDSTTTCTFDLDPSKTLPSDFRLGIGDSTPAGDQCTEVAANQYECTNVPTGSQVGSQDVFGQIGANPKEDTTGDTNVSPKVLDETDDWSLEMDNLDCGNPIPNSTTTCTFDIPANRAIPADLTLAIGDSVTDSNVCTQSGTLVTCTSVPTGSQTGPQDLMAKIAAGTPFDTNEDVTVGNTPLTTPEAVDTTVYCESTSDPSTTCYMVLPPNTTMPTGNLQFGVGPDATTPVGGNCTVAGNLVTCTNVPVDVAAGPGDLPIFVQVDSDPVTDTGEDVYILIGAGNDVGYAMYDFTPVRGEGGSTPLFKDSSPVTLTLKDLATGIDPDLVNANYTCTIEVAPFQPNSETQNWITLADADGVAYDVANGCSGTLPKTIRGIRLNWSIKTTVTDTSNPARSFEFYDAYAFIFAGSGA